MINEKFIEKMKKSSRQKNSILNLKKFSLQLHLAHLFGTFDLCLWKQFNRIKKQYDEKKIILKKSSWSGTD